MIQHLQRAFRHARRVSPGSRRVVSAAMAIVLVSMLAAEPAGASLASGASTLPTVSKAAGKKGGSTATTALTNALAKAGTRATIKADDASTVGTCPYQPADANVSCTISYAATNTTQQLTVPAGVSPTITLDGAQGGDGGNGGSAKFTLPEASSDRILDFQIGQGGGDDANGTAGWPDGGSGGNGHARHEEGCGGGGSTRVELDGVDGVYAIAGGGGGCGGSTDATGSVSVGSGGSGGSQTNSDGTVSAAGGGGNGELASDNTNDCGGASSNTNPYGLGGGGATQSGPGSKGLSGCDGAGVDGEGSSGSDTEATWNGSTSQLSGGTGGNGGSGQSGGTSSLEAGGGGGGGGGCYGGGGGGGAATYSTGGGGGGGSSCVASTATDVTYQSDVQSSNGQATVSWTRTAPATPNVSTGLPAAVVDVVSNGHTYHVDTDQQVMRGPVTYSVTGSDDMVGISVTGITYDDVYSSADTSFTATCASGTGSFDSNGAASCTVSSLPAGLVANTVYRETLNLSGTAKYLSSTVDDLTLSVVPGTVNLSTSSSVVTAGDSGLYPEYELDATATPVQSYTYDSSATADLTLDKAVESTVSANGCSGLNLSETTKTSSWSTDCDVDLYPGTDYTLTPGYSGGATTTAGKLSSSKISVPQRVTKANVTQDATDPAVGTYKTLTTTLSSTWMGTAVSGVSYGGQVNFYDSPVKVTDPSAVSSHWTQLCQGTSVTSGAATCKWKVTPGLHYIIADYVPGTNDTQNTGSFSKDDLSVQADAAATTTTFHAYGPTGTAAGSSLTVTAGQGVTFTASTTYGSGATPVPSGAGTYQVDGLPDGMTCAVNQTQSPCVLPTTGSPYSLTVEFVPSDSDFGGSTSLHPFTLTVDPLTVTLQLHATATTVDGKVRESLTATLKSDSQYAGTGTLSFYTYDPATKTAGSKALCPAQQLLPAETESDPCVVNVLPGATPSFIAEYVGDDTIGTPQNPGVVESAPFTATSAAPQASTTVSIDPTNASITYGTGTTVTAKIVSSLAGYPYTGDVGFTVGSVKLCTGVLATETSPDTSQDTSTATCTIRAGTLAAGDQKITAHAVGDDEHSASTTDGSQTLTVEQLATTLAFGNVSVDGSDVDVSVTASSANPAFAPTGGKITVTATDTKSSDTFTCTISVGSDTDCDLTLDFGTYDLSASYDGSTDFVASASIDYQHDPISVQDQDAACSGDYATLWSTVTGGTTSITKSLKDFASITANVTSQPTGACQIKDKIPFTVNASTTLRGLATASLSGDFEQGTDDSGALMCLTGGTVSLPNGWGAAFTLSKKLAICLTLGADGSVTGVSGTLSASNVSLPLFTVPGNLTGTATLTIGYTKGSGVTATVASTVTSTNPDVTGTLTVPFQSDGTVSCDTSTSPTCGQVSLTGLTLDSVPVTVGGTFGYASGKLTSGSQIAVSTSSPLKIDSAVTVGPLSGQLTTDGLTASGEVTLGAAGQTTTAAVAVTFSGLTAWSATLTGSTDTTWTPLTGLSIDPAFTGTICDYPAAAGTAQASSPCDAGNHTAGLSYALSAGSTAAPAATLTAAGVTAELDTIALTSGGCGTARGPSLTIGSGSISLGTDSTRDTAAISGCVALAGDGYVSLAAASDRIDFGALPGSLHGVTATVDGVPGALTITGSGSFYATPASGSQVQLGTANMQVVSGKLSVVGYVDLTPLGLPVSGYVTYSQAASTIAMTDPNKPGGTVSVVPGLSARGSLGVTAATHSALSAVGINVPAGTTLNFTASFASGSAQFSATVAVPGSAPGIVLPGMIITTAQVTYQKTADGTTFGVTIAGTAGSATFTVGLTYDSSKSEWDGNAEVDSLTVFGQTFDKATGSITIIGGKVTGDVEIDAGTLTLPGTGLSATGVKIIAGSSGLSALGAVVIDGRSIAFGGTISSTKNYTLTVSGSLTNWQPLGSASSVSISATLTGTVTGSDTATTISVSAAAPSGGTLAQVGVVTGSGSSPTAVSMALTGIGFGTGNAPDSCGLPAGDQWITVTGSVNAELAGETYAKTGTGCIDVTTRSLAITASIPFSIATSTVSFSNATITVAYTDGTFSAGGSGRLTVTLPWGGTATLTPSIKFSNGGFVIGVDTDLSGKLGSFAADVGVFYASQDTPDYDTGVGTANLKQGINLAVDFTLPDAMTYLQKAGFPAPDGGASLTAVATWDSANGSLVLSIGLSVGSNPSLVSANNSSETMASLALQITLAPGDVAFALVMTMSVSLDPGSSGNQQTFTFTGSIGISDEEIQGYLKATDIPTFLGFHLSQLVLQLGINAEGVPSVGLGATIDGWPSWLTTIAGIQPTAPVTFDVNLSLDQLFIEMSIGTQGSNTPALEPFTVVGQPHLLEVDFAQLYFAPEGGSFGGVAINPGFSLDFDGSLYGVPLNFNFDVNTAALSMHFSASIGQIKFGSLVLGPVTVTVDAGLKSGFQVGFDASLSIGPGTVSTGPLTQLSGSLTANVHFSVGASGLDASFSGSLFVQGADYEPITCDDNGLLYTCGHQWVNNDPLNFSISNLSLDVSASGIKLGVPDTDVTITIPFPGGGTSTDDAAYTQLAGKEAAPSATTLAATAQDSTAQDQPPVAKMATPPAAARARAATPAQAEAAATAKLHPSLTSLMARQSTVTPDPAAGKWQPTGSMATGHELGAVVTLPDHRVLEIGGADGSTASDAVSIYDPATKKWTAGAAMPQARIEASAVVLKDGDVLVTGGANGAGPLTSTEIYNPGTNAWTTVGQLHTARELPVIALLADGDVLAAGGRGAGRGITALASAERFDPTTGKWTTVAPMQHARALATGTVLADRTVLVVGGYTRNGGLASAERYRPTTNTWTPAGNAGHGVYFGSATVLGATGRVLVTSASGEVASYLPRRNSWRQEQSEQVVTSMAPSVQLVDGDVLQAGGYGYTGPTAAAEEFDPKTRRWVVLASLNTSRLGAGAAALADGTVLVSGGSNGHTSALPSAELFVPTGTNPTTPKPGPAHHDTHHEAMSSSDGGGIGLWWWLVGGVLAAAMIAALGLIYANRRRQWAG